MARANEVLPVPGGPKSMTVAGARSPTLSASSACAKRSDDPAFQELLGRREPLHLLPEARRREVPAVALDDLELLGHHGGSPDVEVESVDPLETLVREGDLPDLARLDQGEHAQGAVMDGLLVQLPEQRRADAPVPPRRVQCQREQMRVATGHRATATPTSCPDPNATAAGCCSLSASTTSLRL